MPSVGEYQKSAGMLRSCGCDHSCACKIPASKTMMKMTKSFKIESPMYKGNAVLNAQK